MIHPVIEAALLGIGVVTAIAAVAALLFFATEVLERRIATPPPSGATVRQPDESATPA